MTDRIFYEELRATIRDAIASYLDTYTDEELRELATESLNLPPRPTLPDGWKLADHEKYGRVVVTNPTPDIDGYVYFVLPARDVLGYDWHFCRPDDLTYIDQEAGDVTPARVGDTIESAADPRLPSLPVGSILLDRDGETVAKRNEEKWVGLGRIPVPSEGGESGPWEVIHTGLEADQ